MLSAITVWAMMNIIFSLACVKPFLRKYHRSAWCIFYGTRGFLQLIIARTLSLIFDYVETVDIMPADHRGWCINVTRRTRCTVTRMQSWDGIGVKLSTCYALLPQWFSVQGRYNPPPPPAYADGAPTRIVERAPAWGGLCGIYNPSTNSLFIFCTIIVCQ